MDIYEIAKKTIQELGGIASNVDFSKKGLLNYQISDLSKKGYLERVQRGYYKLKNQTDLTDELIIKKLFPDGILCMDSALFQYGYSDRVPSAWTVAFPRTVSRSRFKSTNLLIKPYFVRDSLLPVGKTTQQVNGVTLPIYDKERTICDCFKFRNKIDSELFNDAINAYANDPHKNLKNLTNYAKKMRVYENVKSIMGVLLND